MKSSFIKASLQHHFLIAMPSLADTLFSRAVIYVCEHDEQGAMGLIINRPTQVMLTELLSHLDVENHEEQSRTIPVLFGGPVQKGQGMVIHNSHAGWKSSLQLSPDLFLTTSTDILEKIGTEFGPNKSLITLGYSGWDSGQLEQEIAENSWLTVSADNAILFDTPTEECWQAAAKLLGVNINLMTSMAGHA